ncbi:VPGUxxT family thioredoxin-like (seleno)protein, type 2 [Aquimarina litoralis]|uniref:VPGUxxT family thioredoxin-like (seleno)protein, type 2 n=1 Tax=Aquimarina litoralis TaxID=584605 RepID=UPI001C58D5C7|nr:VPGUxxT family thioredoxin-like (seleno)protein, type 2 [Aquimarina litoralis]MBW1298668.1 thioredoxin family protein [Aquimarina litoralis]
MSVKFQYSLFLLLIGPLLFAQQTTNGYNQSEELGKVAWLRDYDTALKLAKKENKDVLILFQEVPGCSTCRNYGHNVLSHPLMVEAIENSFVALAIFNNKGGKDAEILRKYKEPSWNNPVVRIVDHTGQNVVNRIGNDYSAIRLVQSMKEAIETKGKVIPEYINLLEKELLATNTNKAYYKMSCFWSGEKELGRLPAVLSTESGFIDYREVVEVTYDSKEITKKELDNYAKNSGMSLMENKKSYRSSPKDIHYYLQQTKFIYIPLTELQKTKINSALGDGRSTEQFLSPTQKKWFKKIHSTSEILFSTDFTKAWHKKAKEMSAI